MTFTRRFITKTLDLLNLQRHNDNYADIEADLTDHEQRITVAKTEIDNHKASEAAHAAEHITYAGSVVGAGNIQEAVDFVDDRLDTIIGSGSEDKDPELTDIQTPDPSYTPGRTIAVAGDMVRDMQKKFSEQLADTVPFLDNGKIILPSDFPSLPFGIYKRKTGEFYSDATPYNQFDWSDAVNIYIKCAASGSDGRSYKSPVTLSGFRTAFVAGTYGASKKFILNFMDYVYYLNSSGSNSLTLDIDADILMRPSNAQNFTWFGRVKSPVLNTYTSAWVADSGVYKTTQTTSHDILDVANLTSFDDFGMPRLYQKAASLAECQATEGTFFRSNADVWVHPYSDHAINDLVLVVSTMVFTINQANARTTIFDRVGFLPSTYQTGTGGSTSTVFYFFGCKFHRALNNGLYLNGAYRVHSFDCVVSHPTLDCYNYHTTNLNSVATEVNCIGYGAGKYKLTTGQPTHSNNGSTAHDGMNVFRTGSRYYECEGPIVADVNNCYSISIGVEASGILDSTTATVKPAFSYDNADSTNPERPKYVIECKGYGKNVDYGVSGTDETYVANFSGVPAMLGNIKGRGDLVWN